VLYPFDFRTQLVSSVLLVVQHNRLRPSFLFPSPRSHTLISLTLDAHYTGSFDAWFMLDSDTFSILLLHFVNFATLR
jgi:hypothetical protein